MVEFSVIELQVIIEIVRLNHRQTASCMIMLYVCMTVNHNEWLLV